MTASNDRYPIRAVLDHLSSVGLLDRQAAPEVQRIASLPFRELVDAGVFIVRAAAETAVERKPHLSHCASVGLSGGTYPCAAPDCRLDRSRDLARYAIMLSDRVYTYNPFSQFVPTSDGVVDIADSDDLRLDFWAGLRILREWAPLIEEGLVFPFPHTDHYCHWCLARISFGPDAGPRLDHGIAAFKRRFRLETRVTLRQDEYGFHLDVRGPEDVIPHGRSLSDLQKPPRSMVLPQVLRRLSAGHSVEVPPRVAQGLRLATNYSDDLLHTVRYGLVASELLGTAYVTDAPAEVDLLAVLSDRHDIVERNRIAAKCLSSVIPFLRELPIGPLLKLRADEGDAFLRYRSALAEAALTLRSEQSGTLSERDARSVFNDVVAPELARIEILVRGARRRALSGTARAVAGWGIALGVGLYSGLVPRELLEAAKALGATALIKELVAQLATVRDAESSVRHESYYFLWRAQRLSRLRHDA